MDKLDSANIREVVEKINRILENKSEVIVYDTTTTDDTVSLTVEDSGKTIVFDKADGCDVTLPPAEVGLKFRFVVNTTVTSNDYSITAGKTTDLFVGALTMVDTDSSDAHTDQVPDVSDDDAISMNGSTKGGLIGSYIEIECIKANRWWVQGVNRYTGNVATPFS